MHENDQSFRKIPRFVYRLFVYWRVPAYQTYLTRYQQDIPTPFSSLSYMMMNNLHCSGVSESGAVAEMVFGLVFLSLVSLTCDKEELVGVNVLLGVPDFSVD